MVLFNPPFRLSPSRWALHLLPLMGHCQGSLWGFLPIVLAIAFTLGLVFSAPQVSNGRVFIYSGNTALSDPVVANDDTLTPSLSDGIWEIGISPNPIGQSDQLRVELIGDAYQKQAGLSVELYNIKGQKLQSNSLTTNEMEHKTIHVDTTNLSTGIYILAVKHRGQAVITKRITVW